MFSVLPQHVIYWEYGCWTAENSSRGSDTVDTVGLPSNSMSVGFSTGEHGETYGFLDVFLLFLTGWRTPCFMVIMNAPAPGPPPEHQLDNNLHCPNMVPHHSGT